MQHTRLSSGDLSQMSDKAAEKKDAPKKGGGNLAAKAKAEDPTKLYQLFEQLGEG